MGRVGTGYSAPRSLDAALPPQKYEVDYLVEGVEGMRPTSSLEISDAAGGSVIASRNPAQRQDMLLSSAASTSIASQPIWSEAWHAEHPVPEPVNDFETPGGLSLLSFVL